MKNKIVIREISDRDFDPNYQMGSLNGYGIRRASRGVLINGNKIALLNATKYNYHKLPGGGIEKGESINQAFKREILEEVGCDCEILDQSGFVIEWRDKFKLLQISYVFLAKVVSKVGKNKFEQDEINEGFKLEWMPFKNATKILEEDKSINYEGNFVKLRDISIIEFYKDKLS